MSKEEAVSINMNNKERFMLCNKHYMEQMIEKVKASKDSFEFYEQRKTVNIYKGKLKNLLQFRKINPFFVEQ